MRLLAQPLIGSPMHAARLLRKRVQRVVAPAEPHLDHLRSAHCASYRNLPLALVDQPQAAPTGELAGPVNLRNAMKDQDGTFIQFNESVDVNPAAISILRYPKTGAVAGLEPVFRPRGLDRVTVSVATLDKSAELLPETMWPGDAARGRPTCFRDWP